MTLGNILEVFRMLLHQGIWRKCIFARALSNLAWWCKVENSSASILFFWSVSHDCAKISHGHAKSLFHNFPMCCSHNLSVSFRISHGHAKSKIMLFRLLFAISLISSCLTHLHHLQLSSKAWSKCISSSSSSTLCILLHSIFHLSLHASKITLKYLQNSTKNH